MKKYFYLLLSLILLTPTPLFALSIVFISWWVLLLQFLLIIFTLFTFVVSLMGLYKRKYSYQKNITKNFAHPIVDWSLFVSLLILIIAHSSLSNFYGFNPHFLVLIFFGIQFTLGVLTSSVLFVASFFRSFTYVCKNNLKRYSRVLFVVGLLSLGMYAIYHIPYLIEHLFILNHL